LTDCASYRKTGKKQEDDKMAELAKKYRDGAGDKQDGANPDYQAEDPLSPVSGCRAVAPGSAVWYGFRRKTSPDDSRIKVLEG
jgi:hypothetical protein